MIVIPAIDLKDGKAVRLMQGDARRATVYFDDPAEAARRWRAAGAELLHIVDLDGAFSGRPVNGEAIQRIVEAFGGRTELGGGVRDLETIRGYLETTGVGRVILGTAAVRDPDLVGRAAEAYPGRVAVGVDARDGRVAVSGWVEGTDLDGAEFAARMALAGACAIIYTDVARDGMLAGPNIEQTRRTARAVGAAREGVEVIASGGVSCLGDLEKLKPLAADGVTGVISGKALYDGRLDLAEAIECLRNV